MSNDAITGEKLCRMLCEAKAEEKQCVYEKVIELGSNIEEPLAYLAVAYAYAHKPEEKAKALPFYEKWEENSVFYDNLIKHPKYWYLDISEIYEKEFMFDKTIECLRNHFANLYKDCKIVSKKRITNFSMGNYDKVNCLTYKSSDGEADFYYQFTRIGEFYLKMGTTYAMEYWDSLRSNPYYEEGSEFKNMVELHYALAESKHYEGYVYKPLTKANQEKFLTYAKEKGWR